MKTFLILISFGFIAVTFSQWTLIDTGFEQVLTSISVPDENTVWVCGHLGRVCKTTDNGVSWSNSIVTPDTLTLVNIFGIDQNTALAVAKDYSPAISSVWKTTNGGGTWQQVITQNSGQINAVEVKADGTGIMVGNPVGGRWSIWRTTNYGSSWDSTGMYVPGTGSSNENSLFVNGSSYWFGASGGRIYYTSNAGANWSVQTHGSTNIIGIWLNGSTGIATGSGIFRTTNGGANWQGITNPSAGYQLPVAGFGPNFWMVSKGSVFIHSTTNNGDSWNTYSSTPQFTDIACSRSGNRIWISATSQYVLKYTGDVGVQQVSSSIPSEFSLSQNYPNPFNPETKFEFRIAEAEFVKLSIYNTAGMEVATLQNGPLKPGVYKAEWNASGYPSGVYFYTIDAGKYMETKKMILIK